MNQIAAINPAWPKAELQDAIPDVLFNRLVGRSMQEFGPELTVSFYEARLILKMALAYQALSKVTA